MCHLRTAGFHILLPNFTGDFFTFFALAQETIGKMTVVVTTKQLMGLGKWMRMNEEKPSEWMRFDLLSLFLVGFFVLVVCFCSGAAALALAPPPPPAPSRVVVVVFLVLSLFTLQPHV